MPNITIIFEIIAFEGISYVDYIECALNSNMTKKELQIKDILLFICLRFTLVLKFHPGNSICLHLAPLLSLAHYNIFSVSSLKAFSTTLFIVIIRLALKARNHHTILSPFISLALDALATLTKSIYHATSQPKN